MAFNRMRLIGGVGLVLAALAPAALAQDQAKVLEQRQALMKAIGGNMKALNEIARGDRDEGPQDVARRAREINESAKRIAVMFQPEVHIGNVSGDLKTTAKPEIWQEPEKFRGGVAKLDQASLDLAAAADSGDKERIRTAVADLAKTCGGCHEVFRVKKQ